MIKVRISPGNILQVELCEGVVGLSMTSREDLHFINVYKHQLQYQYNKVQIKNTQHSDFTILQNPNEQIASLDNVL